MAGISATKIKYLDKVPLNENPAVEVINKVTADDLNEIKTVFNALCDTLASCIEDGTSSTATNKALSANRGRLLAADISTLKTQMGNVVTLDGSQTITGAKTFSSFPGLPSTDPTGNTSAVHVQYVAHQISPVVEQIEALEKRVKTLEDNAITFVKTGSF